MLKGNKKIFLNHYKLVQMLSQRADGMSINTLALIYNCDPRAIRFQCKRYNIEPEKVVYDLIRMTAFLISDKMGNIRITGNEVLNLGKSYKEYLKYSP